MRLQAALHPPLSCTALFLHVELPPPSALSWTQSTNMSLIINNNNNNNSLTCSVNTCMDLPRVDSCPAAAATACPASAQRQPVKQQAACCSLSGQWLMTCAPLMPKCVPLVSVAHRLPACAVNSFACNSGACCTVTCITAWFDGAGCMKIIGSSPGTCQHGCQNAAHEGNPATCQRLRAWLASSRRHGAQHEAADPGLTSCSLCCMPLRHLFRPRA